MDWIKRNYDQFILGIVALLLLAASGLLIYSAIGFQHVFDDIRGQVIHNNTIPKVAMDTIQQAAAALQQPAKWVIKDTEGSLFVSTPYIVDSNGNLLAVSESSEPLHPPVPNKWLMEHHLDILDNNVLSEDPDGDGFTNLDEWKGAKGDGSDATDPLDKNSHPPYYTKLRLIQYIKQPFRLLLAAWDGDPAKPDTLSFQINTVDVNQPTQFVKIGDTIAGTKFKVIKFEKKEEFDPAIQINKDVSELTVQHIERGDNVTLVLGQVANSPDSYALFRYLWNNTQFQVQKNREFALLPDANLRYKLIDIADDHALIQTPTGQQVTVPLVDKP